VSKWLKTAGWWYDGGARRLNFLQDGVLLLVRLYWGWQLVGAGWGKLMNVAAAALFFEGIGIPWPTGSAVLSGGGEFVGGLLLIAGLASRPAALVVLANMTVALLTAHAGDAQAVLAEPSRLITSPPFTFLLASLIVLLHGPGIVSLDALIRGYLVRRGLIDGPATVGGTPPEAVTPDETGTTRREVGRLTVVAVGGLLAGLGLRGLLRENRVTPGGGADDGGPPPAANLPAIQEIDAKAPPEIQPSLLLAEPHTCCGLNTCKGKAKDGNNACLGQGTCATAKGHVCQAQNECKGQGGCGEYPGQNKCKGKGACAVPLKKDQWDKARKRFEELMKLAGKAVGRPPPNCPKA